MKVRTSKKLLKAVNDHVLWMNKRKLFLIFNNGQVSIGTWVKKRNRIAK